MKRFQPLVFVCFRAVTKNPFFAAENRGCDPQHKETRSFQPLHWYIIIDNDIIQVAER